MKSVPSIIRSNMIYICSKNRLPHWISTWQMVHMQAYITHKISWNMADSPSLSIRNNRSSSTLCSLMALCHLNLWVRETCTQATANWLLQANWNVKMCHWMREQSEWLLPVNNRGVCENNRELIRQLRWVVELLFTVMPQVWPGEIAHYSGWILLPYRESKVNLLTHNILIIKTNISHPKTWNKGG